MDPERRCCLLVLHWRGIGLVLFGERRELHTLPGVEELVIPWAEYTAGKETAPERGLNVSHEDPTGILTTIMFTFWPQYLIRHTTGRGKKTSGKNSAINIVDAVCDRSKLFIQAISFLRKEHKLHKVVPVFHGILDLILTEIFIVTITAVDHSFIYEVNAFPHFIHTKARERNIGYTGDLQMDISIDILIFTRLHSTVSELRKESSFTTSRKTKISSYGHKLNLQ